MNKIIIIVFFFFFSIQLVACECTVVLTACQTLHNMGLAAQLHPEFTESQLVVKAKVLNHQYHGVQIEVLDVILGSETRDTLMVWGYSNQYAWDFANCRTDVTNFVTNDTMIFIIGRNFNVLIDTLENSANDYIIGTCGVFYLNYHKGNVEGSITTNLLIESMPYEEFKEMVPNCYTTAIEEVGLATNFVYPNPFSEVLFVANNQSVRVFDTLGRVVYVGTTTPNVPINLSHLPTGIYYIETTQSNKQSAKMQKVLKM